jgi:hypothetical protein
MTPLRRPPEVEKGWTPSNAPDLWKWEKPGQLLTGVLLSLTRAEIDRKAVTQMLFQVSSEHQVKCLQTYDLMQKIGRQHIGTEMRITYLGEDENIKRGDNAMKVFDVQYKRPEGVPARDTGPAITDEDIPF